MLVQMDARPGRTQAHIFLGDARGRIAARVVRKQGGREGADTYGEAGPYITENSGGPKVVYLSAGVFSPVLSPLCLILLFI
jgi:hypothetical protein